MPCIVVASISRVLWTILVLVGIVGSPPNPALGQNTTQIRIAMTPFIEPAIILVADHQGFLKERGISIRTFDTTWDAQYDLLAGNAVDMAASTVDELVVKDKGLRAIGRQVLYILPAWQFVAISFFANKDMETLDDIRQKYGAAGAERRFLEQLRNRKVAYPEGGVFEQAFSRFVKRAGMSLSDFSIVNVQAEAGLNGLEDRSVGVAAVGSQQRVEAFRRGYKIAISPRDLGLTIITGFVARADFIQQNPDLPERFACAWYRSVKFVNENPKVAYDIINSYMAGRGATTLTYKEYLEMKQVTVMPASAVDATALFLNEDSPAYWMDVWNTTVENMRETGKGDAVPTDRSSFIAPTVIARLPAECRN